MNSQPNNPNAPLLVKIADLLQRQIDDAPQMHAELLDALQLISQTLAEILQSIKTQPMAQPASQPAVPTANVRDFTAEILVMTTDDNGKPAFKIKGFPFNEFGVRVWPEILPAIGIEPAAVKPGPNQLPAGLTVRAVLNEKGSPKKIIGLGDGSAMGSSNGSGNGHLHEPESPPADEWPF